MLSTNLWSLGSRMRMKRIGLENLIRDFLQIFEKNIVKRRKSGIVLKNFWFKFDLKNSRDIPKVKNPEKICINPGNFAKILGIKIPNLSHLEIQVIFPDFNSGLTFFLLRVKFSNYPEKINPDPRFRDFRDFSLGIFRDFQIPIPIPAILEFSGFSDLAQSKKSRSPGFWDFRDFSI